MGRYHVLDEVAVADFAVDIDGDDLPDLFATAARALAELMVDPSTLGAAVEAGVTLSAPELDLLLYDWLSELIFRKDRDGEIFFAADIEVTGASPYRLDARLRGGVIDRETTSLRADAKAVTFHQLTVERSNGGWRARVVIDI
jgi:SHS2 domain-containing protein